MQDATASTDALPLYASVYPFDSLRIAENLGAASLDDTKLDGIVHFVHQGDLQSKAMGSTRKRLSQARLPRTARTARRSSDMYKRCSAVSFESQYGMPLDAQTRQSIFGASTLARPSHIQRAETDQWHICLLPPSTSPAEEEAQAEAEADTETETETEPGSTQRPEETHDLPASFSRSETGCEAATKSKGAAGTQMQGSARAVWHKGSSASSTHTHMPSRLSPRSVNLRTALVLPALSTATSPTTARLSARMLLQSCIGAELENLGLRRLFGR